MQFQLWIIVMCVFVVKTEEHNVWELQNYVKEMRKKKF